MNRPDQTSRSPVPNAAWEFRPPSKPDPAILFVQRIRFLLVLLVTTMVLEGAIRKLVGFSLGNYVFLLKDAITFAIGLVLFFYRFPTSSQVLMEAYGFFFFAMLVPFAMTLGKDPKLAIFGLKQYALFPIVAFGIVAAYGNALRDDLQRFFRWPAFLLIPVTLVAMLELKLPNNNWLNMSVGGEDMSGFAAAGHLRVCSTFPFVAQFAMYINASMYMLGAYLLLHWQQTKRRLYFAALLCVLLVISSFITGSRTAVLGNTATLAIAGALLLVKGSSKATSIFVGLAIVGGIALYGARTYFPEAFQAYDARSASSENHTQEEEVRDRMIQAFFRWSWGIGADYPPTMLGYGLGVMSNGSDRISPSYAGPIRNAGIWGETDLSNTLFDGGYYLVFVFMAFRIFTVLHVLQRIMKLKDPQLFGIGALIGGYTTVQGLIGTLGIQPPLAIWFWLAVGTVIVLGELDKRPNVFTQPTGEEVDLMQRFVSFLPGHRPIPRSFARPGGTPPVSPNSAYFPPGRLPREAASRSQSKPNGRPLNRGNGHGAPSDAPHRPPNGSEPSNPQSRRRRSQEPASPEASPRRPRSQSAENGQVIKRRVTVRRKKSPPPSTSEPPPSPDVPDPNA